MSMKRVLGAFVASVLSVVALVGCGGTAGVAGQAAGDKIEVVCATFPAYDWTCAVVGDEADRFDITYLMSSGVDLHSYQPTVEDIAKISNADLFVYVGGESDEWAEDAIANAVNPDLHTVSMLEAVGDAAVEEELVEGMEGEEEEEEGEEEGPEYDEHVWLSLRNAQTLVDTIAGELEDIDPDNASVYATNADAYDEQLADLDARYADAVATASKNTVVFGDRFPFRYLVDDYGLKYYAAFVGCSAETEASFETVAFLSQKVDELEVSALLIIENSDEQIVKTIIANTRDKNQKILVMDSLQSANTADVEAGKTYLGTMENNLDVLVEALA